MSDENKWFLVLGYRAGAAEVCTAENKDEKTANICTVLLNEKATSTRILGLIDFIYSKERYVNVELKDFIGATIAWAGEVLTTKEMFSFMENLRKDVEGEDKSKNLNKTIESYKESVDSLLQ